MYDVHIPAHPAVRLQREPELIFRFSEIIYRGERGCCNFYLRIERRVQAEQLRDARSASSGPVKGAADEVDFEPLTSSWKLALPDRVADFRMETFDGYAGGSDDESPAR